MTVGSDGLNFLLKKVFSRASPAGSDAACLVLGQQLAQKGVLPGIIGFGVGAGWLILVHEPGRLTNRLPGNPARVGGQWINIHSGRHDDPTCTPQG